MKRYDTYKDSGVQWLGEIPGHWGCVRVKALFDNIREKNSPILTEERLSLSIDKGVTLYSEKTTNLDRFKEDCSQYLLARPNDIVLNSMNMIVGAVGKSRYFGCVSPAYYVIRLRNNSNHIDYYSHLLNIQKIRDVYRIMGKGIMAIDRGEGKVNTCRLKVPYDSFGSIRVPLPPLSEQHSIVSYLDDRCGKIDEWVTKKQNEVEHLQELKQRVIADAVTRGLNPHVKMKATNIPWLKEIPEHWDMSKISSHFRQRNEKVSDKDYPALSVSKQGVTPQLDNVALSNAEGTSRKLVKVGDYAVNSRSDRKGSCGVSKYEGSVSLITIVLEPFNLNGEYVHYLFRSNPWVEEFYRNGRGIVADLWTTNYQMMKSMYMPVPPLSEQKQIVSYLDAKTSKIDKLIANITKEIERIKEYKQRLISDVVTGQIKVS